MHYSLLVSEEGTYGLVSTKGAKVSPFLRRNLPNESIFNYLFSAEKVSI